jgi:hypothetical protein
VGPLYLRLRCHGTGNEPFLLPGVRQYVLAAVAVLVEADKGAIWDGMGWDGMECMHDM